MKGFRGEVVACILFAWFLCGSLTMAVLVWSWGSSFIEYNQCLAREWLNATGCITRRSGVQWEESCYKKQIERLEESVNVERYLEQLRMRENVWRPHSELDVMRSTEDPILYATEAENIIEGKH